MERYVYYCGQCNAPFEIDVERVDGEVPLVATCPTCGNPKALRAFSAEVVNAVEKECKPGSGC